jgi:hypothetical protein
MTSPRFFERPKAKKSSTCSSPSSSSRLNAPQFRSPIDLRQRRLNHLVNETFLRPQEQVFFIVWTATWKGYKVRYWCVVGLHLSHPALIFLHCLAPFNLLYTSKSYPLSHFGPWSDPNRTSNGLQIQNPSPEEACGEGSCTEGAGSGSEGTARPEGHL